MIADELKASDYGTFEIEDLFKPIRQILIYAEPTKKQYGKAKDLAAKRKVPLLDAMHAIIARDEKAILVSRDNHFKKLLDITKPKKPEEII